MPETPNPSPEEVEWPPEAEEPAEEPSESLANDGTPGTGEVTDGPVEDSDSVA